MKNDLSSLRVTSFHANGMEKSAALAQIYKSIIELSRQAPGSHQGDALKAEALRSAVVGIQWWNEPLSRVATNSLSLQHLYSELEATLQLDKEFKVAMQRDKVQLGQRATSGD